MLFIPTIWAVDCSANSPRSSRRTDLQLRRRAGECHVPGPVDRLVQRPLRASSAEADSRGARLRRSLDQSWIPRAHAPNWAGSPSVRFLRSSKKSPRMSKRIQTGWSDAVRYESQCRPFECTCSRLLSIVIPARDEEGCIASTVEHLYVELNIHGVPHEIVVVDDGSTDATWQKLQQACERVPTLRPIQNTGMHGFGRAIIRGFDHMTGDAVVVMMADESDDCRDVVRYWKLLNEGWDAVFGSRFIKGGGVIDYPALKLRINRLANFFIRILFRVSLNDTTNAFKAYRRTVIDGCRPLLSPTSISPSNCPSRRSFAATPGRSFPLPGGIAAAVEQN